MFPCRPAKRIYQLVELFFLSLQMFRLVYSNRVGRWPTLSADPHSLPRPSRPQHHLTCFCFEGCCSAPVNCWRHQSPENVTSRCPCCHYSCLPLLQSHEEICSLFPDKESTLDGAAQGRSCTPDRLQLCQQRSARDARGFRRQSRLLQSCDFCWKRTLLDMIGPKPKDRNRGQTSTSGSAVPRVNSRPVVVSPGSSLYLFSETSKVRVACVKTVTHPWFDRFILLLILLNSIVLAITDWTVIDEDPSSESVGEPLAEGSWRNAVLYDTEVIFTSLFALEFVLKVIAQGFILGHGAYLRDAWNVLDFLVVVTALLTSIPGMPTASAIRVLRVLRPLRSVSALPSLQHLVVSMLKSVPQLVSVVVLLLFIFVVFGIFGIQMFAGKQHSRCRLTPYPVTLGFEVRLALLNRWCRPSCATWLKPGMLIESVKARRMVNNMPPFGVGVFM